MAFSEFPFDAQNPIAYAWPRIRTPMQKGAQNEAVSGKEYRLNYWPWPKWKWQLDYGYLWDDYKGPVGSSSYNNPWMFQALAGFYNQVQGQYAPWLYMDPFDNLANVTNTPGVSGQSAILFNYNGVWNTTANGSVTQGQFCKNQLGGPYEAVQWLAFPSGSLSPFTVYINGAAVGSGTYSLWNRPPALITFNTAPPANATCTWSGNFFYLCRFTKDSFDFSHDWKGKWSAKKIEFQTVFA